VRLHRNCFFWRWNAALCLLAAPALAQPNATDEQRLIDVIERLEKRVTELEAEVSALKADQPQQVDAAPFPAGPSDSEAEQVATETAPDTFRPYWKDGLRFKTEDEAFEFTVGGRLQLDAGWMNADRELETGYGALEDQVKFRRARLMLGATLYKDYFFEVEYDFAGGDPEFKDVFIGMQNIPYLGKLYLGHRKEPFSMDTLTSDNWITLMERSLIETLAPDRNTGITLTNTLFNERATWAAGIYRDTDDFGDGGSDGAYSVTGRVTGLPWYRDEGRKLIHLGGAYSHRNVDDFIQYRTRPEMFTADVRYVDTGSFYVDRIDLFGAEAALQYGPFSLQGEYILSDVDRPFSNDARFDGWHVMGALLLTGEHKPYELEEGVFGRVRPQRNFSPSGGEESGWGAWELALRYSTIDLNDGPFLRGGEEANWTLGLNWYLNPNIRVMWNYVHADIDTYLWDGTAQGLLTRVQVAF
jgi:phosphate-selective porin OprO/OprP